MKELEPLVLEDGSLNLPYIFIKTDEYFPYIVTLLLATFTLVILLGQFKGGGTTKGSNLSTSVPSKAHGILFGKDNKGLILHSPSQKEGHISIFGGSGTGKTTALLIPTLRTFKGNFFCIDISGDIRKNVDIDNCLIFKPEDINNTTKYNVFYKIDKIKDNKKEINQELTALSHIVFPDLSPDSDDASLYFQYEARNIFSSALIAFYHKKFSFGEICSLIVKCSYQTLFNLIDETENTDAIELINRYEGNNEKNVSGVYQTLVSGISLFATNDYVKRCLCKGSCEDIFTPEVLEKKSIFFEVSDSLLEVYAPLIRLIVSQLFSYCLNRENYTTPHILFALDEVASFGRLDIIPPLRKFRKKNVRIMICTQSLADLDLIYGTNERNAMLNNFAFKVVLSATDYDTMSYFSKLTGQKEIKKRSISYSGKGRSTTESTIKEASIEPEEFSKLGDKLVLLYPGGYKLLKKNFFFKKGLLNRLMGVFK